MAPFHYLLPSGLLNVIYIFMMMVLASLSKSYPNFCSPIVQFW